MPLNPFPAGDGRTWLDQAFTTDSGIFPLTGLQNSAIALHLEDINNNYSLYICTGAWSIRDAANGKADFTPSPTDLSTGFLGKGGVYKAYPVVTLASGPVAMDSQVLQIDNKP